MRRRSLIYAVVSCVGVLALVSLFYWGCGQKKVMPAPTKIEVSAPPPICVPHKVVVMEGNSLWKIAKNEWGGRAYFWPVIAETNKLPNPNLILVGQVLTIPCLCDLPVLKKKPVVKKVTKKVVSKTVSVVTPKMVCPECPSVPEPEVAVAPTPVQPPEKVSLPEAPKPPSAPVQPAPVPLVVTQSPPTSQPVRPPAKQPIEEDVIIPPEHQSYHESGLVPVTKQEHWGHGDIERATPGSLWDIVGTSPLEKNNWINYFHVDQGFLLGKIGKVQVVPYVGFNAVKDSKGFPWNNRVQGEVGVKFARPFLGGVIDVGTAFAAERRFGKSLSTNTKTGLIGFAGGWHGWQLPNNVPPPNKLLPGGLPGTFQWRVGNISPFERNNVIGSLRADQGFTLAKFGRVSFIPTASVQAWTDSDKNPWNRRYMYGGGLKVAIPFKASIVDVQGGYMCAKQYSGAPSISGTGCGPAISLNIWTGWGRGKK